MWVSTGNIKYVTVVSNTESLVVTLLFYFRNLLQDQTPVLVFLYSILRHFYDVQGVWNVSQQTWLPHHANDHLYHRSCFKDYGVFKLCRYTHNSNATCGNMYNKDNTTKRMYCDYEVVHVIVMVNVKECFKYYTQCSCEPSSCRRRSVLNELECLFTESVYLVFSILVFLSENLT